MTLVTSLVVAVLGISCSGVAVAVLRRLATRSGVVDVPNERSLHSQPTPRGGGLAIVSVTVLGVGVFVWFSPSAAIPGLWSVLAASIFVAAVGAADDFHPLPSGVRLAVHFVSAILVLRAVGRWQTLDVPFAGAVDVGWVGVPLCIVWIVGLTNAYNFMDGIDGLAGAQGALAGFGWFWLGRLSGQPMVSAIGLLLAAGSLGFLAHNWPPARIFLGDVGSTFLGFNLAALAVIGGKVAPRLVVCGLLLVWPFAFDTLLTFGARVRRGENVFRAHRSHLYQRFVATGCSHLQVTLFYVALCILGQALAVPFYVRWPPADLLTVTVLPLACLMLWGSVTYRERKASGRAA